MLDILMTIFMWIGAIIAVCFVVSLWFLIFMVMLVQLGDFRKAKMRRKLEKENRRIQKDFSEMIEGYNRDVA